MMARLDVVLNRFRSSLAALYGDRLVRVILFGSRARDDARPDSDYDVAIFLNKSEGFGRESRRLAELETDLLYETGAVINALPLPVEALHQKSAFIAELRRDGRDL